MWGVFDAGSLERVEPETKRSEFESPYAEASEDRPPIMVKGQVVTCSVFCYDMHVWLVHFASNIQAPFIMLCPAGTRIRTFFI